MQNDLKNDLDNDLEEIQACQPSSLIKTLIQVQRYIEPKGRDFSYFDSLKCLSINRDTSTTKHSSELRFVQIPKSDCCFAAVSYVCTVSAYEDPAVGNYHIRTESGTIRPARVRDVVLNRVIEYITSKSISSFWIDQECINQTDKQKKQKAIQSMDIIYRRSQYPIGLLSVPLTHQEQANHLSELMEGCFVNKVDNDPDSLESLISSSKAHKVLQTLFRIMCDPWWTRPWTFQEDYCSKQMRLLIPLRPGILDPDTSKRALNDFVIDAQTFRRQVTLFCIACRCGRVFRSVRSRKQHRLVLRRAMSYKEMRMYGRMINDVSCDIVMSARIMADLCHRSAAVQSDTLAIIANCCGYTARLDVEKLTRAGIQSLSLAILALFVINGEILQLKRVHRVGTISKFITAHCFRGLDPPSKDKQLTFMKLNRLPEVQLRNEGIQAAGYLWYCHKIVRLADTREQTCEDDNFVIDQIIDSLNNPNTRRLQKCIKNYRRSVLPCFLSTLNLVDVFSMMMDALVRAIVDGKSLLLAHLAGSKESLAIFVSRKNLKIGSTVFTSFEAADDIKVTTHRQRFLDKFVSLRVDEKGHVDSSVPRLQVQDWVNGIWLPEINCRQQVVFPWPQSLHIQQT